MSLRTVFHAIQGLSVPIGLALDPVLDSFIVLFLRYAPPSLKNPVIGLLGSYSTNENIRRLILILSVNIGLGLARRLNSWVSAKSQNNWTKDEYKWDKEIVLISGGSSGIGERVVEMLSEKQIKVIVLDVQPMKPTLQANKKVHYYECDITNRENIASVAAAIRSDHGDPTILINNAGIGHGGTFIDSPISKVQKIIDVNLVSHFSMIQEYIPAMVKANHGHVVTIASMASFVSVGGMVDYCASKAGLLAVHEGLRQELRHVYKAPKVRTTIVHPSWTNTPILGSHVDVVKAKNRVMPVDEVAGPIVNTILSGEGKQLLLPRHPLITAAASARGYSMWLQEALRNTAQLSR